MRGGPDDALPVSIKLKHTARLRRDWGAHASRVLPTPRRRFV